MPSRRFGGQGGGAGFDLSFGRMRRRAAARERERREPHGGPERARRRDGVHDGLRVHLPLTFGQIVIVVGVAVLLAGPGDGVLAAA